MNAGLLLNSPIVGINDGIEVGISLFIMMDGSSDEDESILGGAVGSTVGSSVGLSVSEDAWVGTLDDTSRGANEPENTTELGNSV